MKTDIKLLAKKHEEKKVWKYVLLGLSCLIVVFTFITLLQPAKTDGELFSYLTVTDNIETVWKTEEWKNNNASKISYKLKLHYVDQNGDAFKYNDQSLTLTNGIEDNTPYGLGAVPISDGQEWGKDLISEWNIKNISLDDGSSYVFQYAEVWHNNAWHKLEQNSENYSQQNWHIWCNDSYTSATTASSDYGWRGRYSTGSNDYYIMTSTTEFRLVYKRTNLGVVPTVGQDVNIKMNLFDYENIPGESGINTNGVEQWFGFRGGNIGKYENITINTYIDEDGYTEKRAKVEPNLKDGYPVFDCRGYSGCSNFSLGYLFGSNQRPVGDGAVTGVTQYNPTNTLLKATTSNGVTTYSYDSKENAVDYDISTNRYYVRPYTENSINMLQYENERINGEPAGEYMPFTNLSSPEQQEKSIDGDNYYYEDSEVNHWHGMSMNFAFNMPKNGELNGTPMEFEFHGDDDVWVYIDGVLILDIGGTHGAVEGKINFKTGEVTTQLKFNGTTGTLYKTTLYDLYKAAGKENAVEWQIIDGNKTLANFGEHQFNFFYLERGAAISNCKIKFNLPPNPGGALSVRKDFTGSSKYDDSEYTFKLYKVDENDLVTKTPVANEPYTLNGTNIGGKTNSKGEFKIKKDDVALFRLSSEEYFFVEESDSGDHAEPLRCIVSGTMCQNSSQTGPIYISPDETTRVVITNQLRPLELIIEKEVLCSHCDDTEEDNTEFEFNLNINGIYGESTEIDVGNNTYEISNGGTVSFKLKDKEKINIAGIPYDSSVKLTEVNYNGYNVIIKDGEGIQTLANGNEYTFILNTPRNEKTKSIKVVNMPGRELPATGGPGIYKYLIIGIGLILTSIIGGIYIFFHKKEGDG